MLRSSSARAWPGAARTVLGAWRVTRLAVPKDVIVPGRRGGGQARATASARRKKRRTSTPQLKVRTPVTAVCSCMRGCVVPTPHMALLLRFPSVPPHARALAAPFRRCRRRFPPRAGSRAAPRQTHLRMAACTASAPPMMTKGAQMSTPGILLGRCRRARCAARRTKRRRAFRTLVDETREYDSICVYARCGRGAVLARRARRCAAPRRRHVGRVRGGWVRAPPRAPRRRQAGRGMPGGPLAAGRASVQCFGAGARGSLGAAAGSRAALRWSRGGFVGGGVQTHRVCAASQHGVPVCCPLACQVCAGANSFFRSCGSRGRDPSRRGRDP